MENKPNIYQRMLLIMGDVQAVQKEDKKVNNMYRYVGHDAVSKAVHMPMVRAGVYMQPDVIEMKQDGNRTEIMMTMTFINVDQPDDRFIMKMPGYGIDPQDKGIGKAISYATKYGYLKAFCLETGDDVEKDNIDHEPKEEKKLLPAKLLPLQVKTIEELLAKFPEERVKKFMNVFSIEKIEEIDIKDYDRILRSLTTATSQKIKGEANVATC